MKVESTQGMVHKVVLWPPYAHTDSCTNIIMSIHTCTNTHTNDVSGFRYSSVVKHLLSTFKALDSIEESNTKANKNIQRLAECSCAHLEFQYSDTEPGGSRI